MRSLHVITLSACALVAGNASASTPAVGSTLIVQQQMEDGRILLTDRPVHGATTQRSWTLSNPARPVVPERTDNAEPIGFYGRVPRHIDAQWRSIDEDPVRERIVRETLERERMQRSGERGLRLRDAAFRGSAAP
jgi:hypothetical protein